MILESEQLLNKTLSDRASRANSENQESQAKFLPGRSIRIPFIRYITVKMEIVGLGLQSIDLSTDNVILNETDTMFILDLESNVVSQEDHDEYDRIKENNKIYIEVRIMLQKSNKNYHFSYVKIDKRMIYISNVVCKLSMIYLNMNT